MGFVASQAEWLSAISCLESIVPPSLFEKSPGALTTAQLHLLAAGHRLMPRKCARVQPDWLLPAGHLPTRNIWYPPATLRQRTESLGSREIAQER